MKLNQSIAKFIYITGKANLPGLIMSDPGIGKTSTVELYCKLFDLNLTTVIASQYAPDDILGVQSVVDGKLVRLAPAWFNELIDKASNGKPNLLFIDELTTCDEFIQAPLLNLIFNKSLGSHKLPENTQIIASGNYQEQLNNAFQMTAPLVNRFMILNISKADININELFSDEFSKIKQSNDIEEARAYLGLYPIEMKVNIGDILNVIKSNVQFNVEIKNSSEEGLVGFGSIRSISYTVKYIETALANGMYDASVIKIVGDTLGSPRSSTWSDLLTKTLGNPFTFVDVKSLTTDELISLVKSFIQCPSYLSIKQYKLIKARSSEVPESLLIQLDNCIIKQC